MTVSYIYKTMLAINHILKTWFFQLNPDQKMAFSDELRILDAIVADQLQLEESL